VSGSTAGRVQQLSLALVEELFDATPALKLQLRATDEDNSRMLHRLAQSRVGIAAALAAVVASPATVALASALRAPLTPATTVAERRVLGVLGRDWSPAHLRGFVDPRTRLPLDNVQARCRPRRGQGARPTRFICVVRPGDRQSAVRLYLSYVLLRSGFRVYWLDLRGR
jgi:hypothetical protein